MSVWGTRLMTSESEDFVQRYLKRLRHNLSQIFWTGLFFIGAIAKLVAEAIRLDLIPMSKLFFFLKDRFPKTWKFVLNISCVKKFVNYRFLKSFGNAAPPPPHQTTMADSYTSWKGITNLKYTGRQLPEDRDYDSRERPDIDEVVSLFVRADDGSKGGEMIPDMRSTLLFAAFAQWFTDSFLRTEHALDYDAKGNVKMKNKRPVRLPGREKENNSTHQIDLCQIYGTSKKVTDILRSKDKAKRGFLKSHIAENRTKV